MLMSRLFTTAVRSRAAGNHLLQPVRRGLSIDEAPEGDGAVASSEGMPRFESPRSERRMPVERSEREQIDPECRVVVTNLPYEVSWRQLRDAMSIVGEVRYARILLDRETKRSRGMGIVGYSRPQDAKSAIERLNDMEVLGRVVRIGPDRFRKSASFEPPAHTTMPAAQDQPEIEQFSHLPSLHFTNLPYTVSQGQISALIANSLGDENAVQFVQMKKSPTGSFSGKARVFMANDEQCQNIIDVFNLGLIEGRRVFVSMYSSNLAGARFVPRANLVGGAAENAFQAEDATNDVNESNTTGENNAEVDEDNHESQKEDHENEEDTDSDANAPSQHQ